MSQKLMCSQGHEWTAEATDSRTACPVCAALSLHQTLDLPAHDGPTKEAERKETVRPATDAGEVNHTLMPPEKPAVETQTPPFSLMGDTLLPPTEAAVSSEAPDQTLVSYPGHSSAPVSPPSREPAAVVQVPGYEILSELGRGGMGVVYKARQLRANRLVALKMILSGGHASRGQLERFRIEGEAVASLHHPNIVQVYEVAEHEGLPFFSLEFLEGGSLADQLDGTPWPAKDTAQLVETLSRAMHHAHEKNIVHRDLKPANILLGRRVPGIGHGEEKKSIGSSRSPMPDAQCPKITDFGLAKQMGSQTGQTQSGDVLGTPSYMAPEQAEGRIHDIGPATDVYALGAILYELVTGRPPFKGTTLLETLEQVRIQEPVAPRQMHQHAPRDLETITLKCLQKDPHKRYGSALELAEDLRRFQDGEPIKARPVSVAERVVRWGRRNPKIAGLLAALVFVTVAGFISVSALWIHAEGQRNRAEGNLKGAVGAVDFYFTNVSENKLVNEPGAESLRRDLLLAARDYYVKFIRENEETADLESELGKSLFRLGQILAEVDSPVKGIEYHQRALALFKKLAKKQPTETAPRADLAATYHHLGRLHRELSQTEESRKYYDEALTLWEQLLRDKPQERLYKAGLARTQMGLGNLAEVMGDYKEAEADYRKALETREELVKQEPENEDYQRDLAVNHNNLAVVLHLTAQHEKVDKESQEAQKGLKGLIEKKPAIIRYQHDLAQGHFNAGVRLAQRTEAAKALAAYKEAETIWRRLGRDRPLVGLFQASLAATYHNEGDVLKGQEQLGEAEKLYAQARKIQEQLTADHPEEPKYQHGLALALRQWGDQQRDARKPDKVLEGYLKALELLETLVSDHPDVVEYRSQLVDLCNQLGLLHGQNKKEKEAEEMYRKGLKVCADLAGTEKKTSELLFNDALCRANLADLERERRKPADALKDYAPAIDVLEGLLKEKFHPAVVQPALRNAYWGQAIVLDQQGEYEKAVKSWEQAIELSDEKQKKPIVYARAISRMQRATAELLRKEPAKALPRYGQTIQELDLLLREQYLPGQTTGTLRNAYQGQALALTETGAYGEALKAWDHAIELTPENQRVWFKLDRLKTLARSGDHVRATQEAETLRPELNSGTGLFGMAGVNALAAGVARREGKLNEAERYATQALELLREAEKKEWFKPPANVKRLQQDMAFDALRERNEFQMFLKRLSP